MSLPRARLRFLKKISVEIRQDGVHVDGEYVEPAPVVEPLIGSVQPATPKDLNSAPEGEEVIAGLKVYTKKSLKNGDILVDTTGLKYRVFSIVPWQDYGSIKAIGGLIDV